MASLWFPTSTNDTPGWRLDIVSLLAVIGESAMAEHYQAMTASWTCVLPRIIPAPQILLKPVRPTRMPSVDAEIVGVANGMSVPTLHYFPQILHPIDLPSYAFRVYEIKHVKKRAPTSHTVGREQVEAGENKPHVQSKELPHPVTASSSTTLTGNPSLRLRKLTSQFGHKESENIDEKPAPIVPVKRNSPLNILALFSFILTLGLVVVSAWDQDGVAIISLATISLASSVVGYASKWSPQLRKRKSNINVPPGDVVILTREGAIVVVKCDENVARELYTGTEACVYVVQNVRVYRALVAIGTFLVMVSVVLLGNCNFNQQAAIGGSYIVLNGLYWGVSLIPKERFWDLSLYEINEVTPAEAVDAENDDASKPYESPERPSSYTRTLWYAIRETKEIGWVRSSNAAPKTEQWDAWLKEAVKAAREGNVSWPAVEEKNRIVGQTGSGPNEVAEAAEINGIKVPGGQRVPPASIVPHVGR